MIGRFIQLEMQLRGVLQVKIFTEATPEVPLGAVQPFDGVLLLLVTSHNADMYPGILEIVTQLNPGHGHKADSRIIQTKLNQFGKFLKEQFLHSL